jgi:hypothetical protein
MYLCNNYKNIIFFDYKKIIFENGLTYINDKLNKFNVKKVDDNVYFNALNNPSKNHGHCVKTNKEMCCIYNEDTNKIKILFDTLSVKKYINDDIIDYFEKND